MEELMEGTKAVLGGETPTHSVFSHPLAFNVIPLIDKPQPNGYTKEEMKVVLETRKIFGLSEPDIQISCTAVRIPTMRVHSESITIETHSRISADVVR